MCQYYVEPFLLWKEYLIHTTLRELALIPSLVIVIIRTFIISLYFNISNYGSLLY
jgi:hypothetical protein